MTKGGGRAAHAFSRGPGGSAPHLLHRGLPQVGQAAVEAIWEQWKPLWQEPIRMQEPDLQWPEDLPDLPALTLQHLEAVLKTYPAFIGMGADDMHP